MCLRACAYLCAGVVPTWASRAYMGICLEKCHFGF